MERGWERASRFVSIRGDLWFPLPSDHRGRDVAASDSRMRSDACIPLAMTPR